MHRVLNHVHHPVLSDLGRDVDLISAQDVYTYIKITFHRPQGGDGELWSTRTEYVTHYTSVYSTALVRQIVLGIKISSTPDAIRLERILRT